MDYTSNVAAAAAAVASVATCYLYYSASSQQAQINHQQAQLGPIWTALNAVHTVQMNWIHDLVPIVECASHTVANVTSDGIVSCDGDEQNHAVRRKRKGA